MLRTLLGISVFSICAAADFCFGIFQEEPHEVQEI